MVDLNANVNQVCLTQEGQVALKAHYKNSMFTLSPVLSIKIPGYTGRRLQSTTKICSQQIETVPESELLTKFFSCKKHELYE